MKNMNNRRRFVRNILFGVFSTVLTFSFFRTGKSSPWTLFDDSEDGKSPKISPAFKMNVFTDGKVELYTHQTGGDKVTTTFNGLEAEVLLKLSKQSDPKLYTQDLGSKYGLEEEAFVSKVNSTLTLLADRGFIYYGEPMLVKIMEAENE
jgi:hypothetical protein